MKCPVCNSSKFVKIETEVTNQFGLVYNEIKMRCLRCGYINERQLDKPVL